MPYKDCFLILSGHYDRDPGLDQFRLRLCSLSKGKQQIWVATSSHRTGQGFEAFHRRGGLIPPEYRVPGLPFWEVNTTPLNLQHVRGVEGEFFQITPYQVTTDKGGIRSDFGIHRDANAPGSLGCPVMSERRFESFKKWMEKVKQVGKLSIPMFVTYS